MSVDLDLDVEGAGFAGRGCGDGFRFDASGDVGEDAGREWDDGGVRAEDGALLRGDIDRGSEDGGCLSTGWRC